MRQRIEFFCFFFTHTHTSLSIIDDLFYLGHEGLNLQSVFGTKERKSLYTVLDSPHLAHRFVSSLGLDDTNSGSIAGEIDTWRSVASVIGKYLILERVVITFGFEQ